ncbi:unnamed protein product [Clonostachys rosea]|uniref:Bromo domain-containing protein n=1 Tax=Bionectria ochroleuca TaxID=29856 RepID=A0ABY6U086_BIOOC|nr:unnamed protein product [Clonostachys rosea]
MAFLTKRLTKDQSAAFVRVADLVRESLDGGSLVPALPESVHSLLREPSEAHRPDETVDEVYKKDFIAIKQKVMELLKQGGEREKFCEEVGRHLDQLPHPKARALNGAARRKGNISGSVHMDPNRDTIAPKDASGDRFTRTITDPSLVVHPTRRPLSPKPRDFEAPSLDDSKTTSRRDDVSVRAVAQARQIPATLDAIVISDQEDTPDSLASASSQSASVRPSVLTPDISTASKLDNISATPQSTFLGPSHTASVAQFLAGTDTTAAKVVDQQSQISSATPQNPFLLREEEIFALQR